MLDSAIRTNIQGPGTRRLTTAWWAVASRFFLHGLIVSTWVSRIPAVQSSLGLTNAGLGLCLLGTAIGSIVGIPMMGSFVSRFGSRNVTAWSTVGFALALSAPACASSALTLFIGLSAFGALAGANDVSINAQGVAFEKAAESPTMSRFHALFSIGGMIGAALGGLIAAHGIAVQTHCMMASILLAGIGLCTNPWLLDADDAKPAKRSSSRRLRVSPLVLTLAFIGFCMFLSEGAIADWSGIYLKGSLGADHGSAAAGYAVFSFGMAIFRLLGDTLTRRFGSVSIVRAGALLAALGLTTALTFHSIPSALTGFVLAGAGFSVIVPLVFAASGRVNSIDKGASIATVSGSGYLGFLAGPPLIGLIAQASSVRSALFLIIALSLVTAILAKAVAESGEQTEMNSAEPIFEPLPGV